METLSHPWPPLLLVDEANSGVDLSPDKVNSRVPGDTKAEITELRFLLEAREYTLTERVNHLSKMMDDLKMKDHQLMLKDRQLESRGCQIAYLEAQLVNVHKNQLKEATGVHSSVCLYLESEKECRQLRRRCRLWRSWALAKPSPSGEASQGEHSS